MYFGVVSPGSTNDNISYTLSDDLKDVFANLPQGILGLADRAYILDEFMLIPYTVADCLDPVHDAFNYYLSQLRIWVELLDDW